MKITFLIGNGFDLNIGLKTTYSDFVSEYSKIKETSEILDKLHTHINKNSELWSDAEIALGMYTNEFRTGEGDKFTKCHKDFCEHLAIYLKRQEELMDYETSKEKIKKAFARLNSISRNFPSQEREALESLYKKHLAEALSFQFICFNYTFTLDKCLEIVRQNPAVLGSHKYKSRDLKHSVGTVCHIHGTVDGEMIFAVNDESQIANISIFDCEYGDLYKNFLIKKQANESFQENTDEKGKNILDQSQIIYIYGMSIGMTDKLWWNRICDWLGASNDHHIIIQKYEMPEKGVFQSDYQLFERKQKENFLNYGKFEQQKWKGIEPRIHITGNNIFQDMSNIANLNEK